MFEEPNVLLVKHSLATINITEAAIFWRSFKKAKSKKVCQIQQN